jgi:hypothetical protein
MSSKIGFCFLIKDLLYNQPVWAQFFKGIPHDEYKIYIHYKTKCDVSLQNYEFIDSIPTQWGTISLVKATFLLFRRASADGCTMMFLLSGDTLPLKPYSQIRTINQTIFRPQNYNPYAKTRFCISNYRRLSSAMRQEISLHKWRKQHMFFCMTAEHFQILLTKPKISHYAQLGVPDEYYFINQCTYLNIPYVTDKYIHVGQTNAKTGSRDVTNHMFRENKEDIKSYYFIRKITDYRTVPDYRALIKHVGIWAD